MPSRNAVEIYDPALARKQQMLAEPHKYAGSRPTGNHQPIQLSADVQQKIANALAKEGEKLRQREEERRRRDPTYRPDAIELSNANLLEFDKYVDYYALLGVDSFASAKEIKDAYKKLSLELHPDKQKDKPEEERAKAQEKFLEMVHAHTILSDLATRRAYDHQRDHLDANNEAGLQDVGKFEKPPPTCVDVMVSLEHLYRGCRKQVEFERNEFANTRWHKKTFDTFSVKINRGELEGATIWHKNQGDCGPFGRCDLVFVVKQEQHPVFERLGDDLWYYDRTPVEASRLFYVGWAPTLGTTKSSAKYERYNGQYRRVAAFGSMLHALLGFDRSGLGEALVVGHGMPLRPLTEYEEREGLGGASDRTKGDLVVKYPIELPRGPDGRHRTPKVHMAVGGPLPMAPIALITPQQPTGLPPLSAVRVLITNTVIPAVLMRVSRQRSLHEANERAAPPQYPPPLLGDEDEDWLLASPLPPSAQPPVHALPFRPTDLVGVCLLVGGPPPPADAADADAAAAAAAAAQPSRATRGLMHCLSQVLPALRWHVIHMAEYLSEPLLADEEELVGHATLLLLEALPDTPDTPEAGAGSALRSASGSASGSASETAVEAEQPAVSRAAAAAAAAVAAALAPAPASAREPWLEEVEGWMQEREWTVAYDPGLFVRTQPSVEGPAAGCVRQGDAFEGKLMRRKQSGDFWVRIDGVGGPTRYVCCARGGAPSPFVRPRHLRPKTPAGGSDAAGGHAAVTDSRPWRIQPEGGGGGRAAAVPTAADAGERAPDPADETAEVKLEVTKRDRDELAEAEAEQAEDASWEADVHGRRDASVDEAYLEAGCSSAASLMRQPSARCVVRCHCEGGVVLAVGRGCSLLGHAGRRKFRPRDGLDEAGPVASLSLAELEAIRDECMADDIPIQLGKMCTWSRSKAVAYFDNNGVLPPAFAGPSASALGRGSGSAPAPALAASGGPLPGLFLPYLIGCEPLPRTPANADGFRGLRAANVRAKLAECQHGFSALALPEGSVVTVLTTHRGAVRSVLGSAQPAKFALKKLQDVAVRRDARIARRKIEVAREAKLEEIWGSLLKGPEGEDAIRQQQEAIREAHKRGYEHDMLTNSLRGSCTACGGCACFTNPVTSGGFWGHSNVLGHCAGCGCSTSSHEELDHRRIPGSGLHTRR